MLKQFFFPLFTRESRFLGGLSYKTDFYDTLPLW